MTETMGNLSENFGRELRSFFALCLMNLVFGALALGFGMQFILTAVLAMAGEENFGLFLFLRALAGWAAAVVGFRWILSSARILKGVGKIRRDYRALEGHGAGAVKAALERPVPEGTGKEQISGVSGAIPIAADALTGLIIGMMAHYRENWKTIWKMNLLSIVGCCIFLVLGVLNLIQGFSALASGSVPGYFLIVQAGLTSGIGRSALLSFLAAGLNLAIGLVSLLSATWFRRFSRAWELRLLEVEHSEEALRRSMEQG